jgi:uncharacterized protein (TIGR02466 family)
MQLPNKGTWCSVMAKPKLVKATPMFATPLFVFEVENPDELNQKIFDEAQAIRAASAGLVRSNQLGWHSDPDLFKRTEPGIKELTGYITTCLSEVVFRTTKDRPTKLSCEGWINVNPKGAFNVPHDHAGYLWSGTYYVRVPRVEGSRSGHIEFLDPRSNVAANAATTFKNKFRLGPRNGQLIVFPSYLTHWVYPNEEDSERMTIAFNASLPGQQPVHLPPAMPVQKPA